MVTLTLELPDELYARLQAAAEQAGESIEAYTVRLLTEILMGPNAEDDFIIEDQPDNQNHESLI